ncbi:isoprenylcysteine carboxylmethyltransferase family protein [Rudaea sp.]|uniref:methyltransferase family protein n=1 Tax=Rudaea sp. TaxID=2136325 RepID=UPI0032201C49
MHWLLCLIAFASFAIYAMAIRSLFSREHGVDPRMKALQMAGVLSALVHVATLAWIADTGLAQGLLAAIVYLGGLGIFFAARREIRAQPLTLAFSPDRPSHLVESGVYRWIRHPFYTAYALTWLGGLITVPNPPVAITSAMMWISYWCAARAEERKFEASPLRDEYRRYRQRSGMFWPACPWNFHKGGSAQRIFRAMKKEIIVGIVVGIVVPAILALLSTAFGWLPRTTDYRIPPDTVASFASTKCPEGWEDYEKAVGRFIIGVGSIPNGPAYSLGQTGGIDRAQFVQNVFEIEQAYFSGGGSYYLRSNKLKLDPLYDGRPPFLSLLICRKR